jgi:hypothetical protein
MSTSNSAASYTYQDFELTVLPGQPSDTYLVIARSSSGSTTGQMTLDPGSEEWHTILDAIEREDTDEDLFLKLGEKLFEALFPDNLEDVYRSSMGFARGAGQGLRIRLRLTDAPQIAALPWEYLRDPQRDIFFAISSDTPLSRFIEPQQLFAPPPIPEGKLRLLSVVSDPQDPEAYGLEPLATEAELNTLDQALQRLKTGNLLEEIPPLRHAVRADISEALREHRPHVLHLIAHGVFDKGQGKLILEDEGHYALPTSDRAFREFLEGYPEVRLVVLNACQGATRDAGNAMVGMGPQLVSRGVPAVVAMQYAVLDRAATSFTREFYRALAHWYPIDVALSQARRAVYLDYGLDRRDWGVPVLFMRDRDGRLFQPPAASQPLTTLQRTVDTVPSAKTEEPIDPAQQRQVLDAYVADGVPRDLERRSNLLQILATGFDQDELQSICFELGVDFENLKPGGKQTKAREMVLYFERRRRVHQLVEAAYRRRPDAPWM